MPDFPSPHNQPHLHSVPAKLNDDRYPDPGHLSDFKEVSTPQSTPLPPQVDEAQGEAKMLRIENIGLQQILSRHPVAQTHHRTPDRSAAHHDRPQTHHGGGKGLPCSWFRISVLLALIPHPNLPRSAVHKCSWVRLVTFIGDSIQTIQGVDLF